MASNYDFTIYQGSTFSRTITYKDNNGDPVDLTGYTARLQVRISYDSDVLLELTTENGGIELGGALGTIRLLASASDTADLDFSKARYDLELVSGSTVTRLLMGLVFLSREVTK